MARITDAARGRLASVILLTLVVGALAGAFVLDSGQREEASVTEPAAGAGSLPITFTDGRRIELRAPSQLGLETASVRTGAAIAWSVRPDPLRCCSKVVMVTRATLASVYGDAEPIATYAGIGGEPVQYFRGADAGRTVWLDYLVFEFGPYLVEVYDVQQPGDFEDRMTERERATWARSLGGHVDAHGYLVLEAKKPLRVGPFAHAVIDLSGPGGAVGVELADQRCDQAESDTEARRHFSQSGASGVAWCDPKTQLHISMVGDGDLVATLADTLELVPMSPGFGERQ